MKTTLSKIKMISTIYFSFLFIVTSCQPNDLDAAQENKYDTLSNEQIQVVYQNQVNIIKKEKNSITNLDSLRTYLHFKLTNEIFPAWYGTEWDYNGYSNFPRKGQIACGYFVSTTLKHIGINVNRFDLAKKYSSSIVRTLTEKSTTFNTIEQLFAFLKDEKDDIFVVGLSNHVGFIEKKAGKTYFIHANYMGPNGVEKEIAQESIPLNSSDVFVIGNLTGNHDLLKKWKNNQPIQIID